MSEFEPHSLEERWKNLEYVDNESFEPEILNLKTEGGRRKMTQLFEEEASLKISDTIDLQLKELIKIKTPQRKFTQAELNAEYEEWKRNNNPMEYGLWVFYPWKHTVVHIVPEEDFIELRVSRNKYKITPQEQSDLMHKRVGVIGLSVGQSVALTMAIERSFGTIRIADFDHLELTNLNRIRRGIDALGQRKTVMVAREIAEIDPFLKVELFTEGITEDNIDNFLIGGGKLDLLIEECDSLDIKILSRLRAREHKIPVIMDTSDRGMVDIERFDLEPERDILHGMVKLSNISELRDLTYEEKIPFILDLVGVDKMSTRLKSSMLEVEQSITTWPQLASDVALGGAVTAEISRKLLLKNKVRSGRYYFDTDKFLNMPEGINTEGIVENPFEELTFDRIRQNFKKYFYTPGSPVEDPGEEVITEIVESASLAPSGGNVQPWKWYYSGKVLYLFHDRYRSFSFLDYKNRGSLIALGAAVENLSLKSRELGFEALVNFHPGPPEEQIASIVFQKARDEKPPYAYLSDFIGVRHTNRKLGDDRKLPGGLKEEMILLSRENRDFDLSVIEDRQTIEHVSQLVGRAERIRVLHPWGHRDFINEARWSTESAQQTRDGIDLATMEMSPSDIAAMEILKDGRAIANLQQWKLGEGFIKMASKNPRHSSAICLLTASSNSDKTVFEGGRVLERLWLYCSSNGIALQPVSPSTFIFERLKDRDPHMSGWLGKEMHNIHKEFKDIFNTKNYYNNYLFLFRLFYAGKPAVRSLRYPLKSILEIGDK